MELKNKEYIAAYNKNEADANKHMSYVNGAASLLSLVLWILYLTKIFTISEELFPIVTVLFPLATVLLIIPVFLVKTEAITKSWYKYFILFSLLIVIIAINITIPKHGMLLWPFAILIANHYYNPVLGRIIYVFTLVMMLICMYLGMLFGEYDLNLLGGGVVVDGEIVYYDNYVQRINMLKTMLLNGENRYVKVLIFYYLPRAAVVTLFFMVSNLLNRRTYKLLDQEIKIHDEQEKSKTELEVAKDIQLSTLPEEFISSKDVEIIGELKAAKEVGGDFYDYLDIDEDHVAIIIGDVSGKGVPAAMFMMKTITSFRDFAKGSTSPSQILREVNASIYRGNKSSMFVTCFLAILNKKTGRLIYANAGHNRPVVGQKQKYHFLPCESGLLLGCFKDAFVSDQEITLNPGDSITLYTDGITEARNNQGGFFGEKRLIEAFNKNDYTCIVELHHAIKDSIATFVDGAPQSDDITFVTLKYQGGHYSYLEKFYDARIENVKDMLALIEDFGEEHHFPMSFVNQLVVVGDELFSNIVNHGYNNKGGDIFVRLLFNDDTNEFALTVIDRATPFNQLEVNDEAYDENTDKNKIGGLGILIVKKIMTEYAYDYINGKNILVLKKRF